MGFDVGLSSKFAAALKLRRAIELNPAGKFAWESPPSLAFQVSLTNVEFRAAITRRKDKFAADLFAPNHHEIVNGSTILSRARVAPMS